MKKLANYINGHETAPASGQYLDNFAPSTGKVYSLVPDSGAEDVNAAVEAAKKIFPWWSQPPREQSFLVLLSIATRLEQAAEDLARAESYDQGKPLHLAREIEIPRAIYN